MVLHAFIWLLADTANLLEDEPDDPIGADQSPE
jgi:hypothetical protein